MALFWGLVFMFHVVYTCPGVFLCFFDIQYFGDKLSPCNPENVAKMSKWVKFSVIAVSLIHPPLKNGFLSFLCLSRATPVRAEAAAVVEEEQGMKTTRSPPSRPPTMPTLLCCTSWSTSQVTPSTPCLTTACSTPTPTPSCPPSWCPTCWVRTPTSSRGLCTQWVHHFCLSLFSCGPLWSCKSSSVVG